MGIGVKKSLHICFAIFCSFDRHRQIWEQWGIPIPNHCPQVHTSKRRAMKCSLSPTDCTWCVLLLTNCYWQWTVFNSKVVLCFLGRTDESGAACFELQYRHPCRRRRCGRWPPPPAHTHTSLQNVNPNLCVLQHRRCAALTLINALVYCLKASSRTGRSKRTVWKQITIPSPVLPLRAVWRPQRIAAIIKLRLCHSIGWPHQ